MIIQIENAILLIAANSLAWFAVIFLSGFLWRQRPPRMFDHERFPFKPFGFEQDGTMYEKKMKIKAWKDMMPEAGGVFKGFGKRHIELRDTAYLETFVRETCRAETVHYTIMAALPLFIIWNPPAAILIMIPIVLAGNIPCIIIQRYNRPRLLNLIRMREN